MITPAFIGNLRTELQSQLQSLLSYNPGTGVTNESTVRQAFSELPESYPQVVVTIGLSSSSPRYVGQTERPVFVIELACLAQRAVRPEHLIACEDGVVRGDRDLVEYVAMKIYNFLNDVYEPSFNYTQDELELELNSDYEEADGIHRSTVVYAIEV